jgi:hypothetical protein
VATPGHTHNALPQRARATVNCRILPGQPVDDVQKTLERVLADDQIKITRIGEGVTSPMPPLTPVLMKAVEEISNDMWPGVPVIPTMSTGGTDGRFLNNAGIWTYGISGMYRLVGVLALPCKVLSLNQGCGQECPPINRLALSSFSLQALDSPRCRKLGVLGSARVTN